MIKPEKYKISRLVLFMTQFNQGPLSDATALSNKYFFHSLGGGGNVYTSNHIA